MAASTVAGWGLSGVLLSTLGWILANPEAAEIWRARICGLFSGISTRAEKETVASDIQGRVALAAKKVGHSVDGLMPYGVKVQWVESDQVTKDSFIADGQVVVALDFHNRNQARNIALVTLGFLSRGLIPMTRPYVGPKIMKSIDFTVASRILRLESPDSLNYLWDEVDHAVENDDEAKDWLQKVGDLDEKGMLMNILLREYARVGGRLRLQNPSERLRGETRGFLEFLRNIAVRERGEETELTYLKNHFRIAVILVAKAEKVVANNAEPYETMVRRHFSEGVEVVYLCALGFNNVKFAHAITDSIRRKPNRVTIEKRTLRLQSGVDTTIIRIERHQANVDAEVAAGSQNDSAPYDSTGV